MVRCFLKEGTFLSHWLIRIFIKDAENTGDARVRNAYANLACVTGILCNVLLFAGKFTVGTLFGSVAIAADAMNNLSDASSNIVSLVGFRLGARPADEKHPFGHARYEYLAGLVVSVMILVIGIELLKESVTKVLHPTPVAFGWLSAAVLVASILIKLWMSLFNKKIGTLIDSETLLATAAEELELRPVPIIFGAMRSATEDLAASAATARPASSWSITEEAIFWHIKAQSSKTA